MEGDYTTKLGAWCSSSAPETNIRGTISPGLVIIFPAGRITFILPSRLVTFCSVIKYQSHIKNPKIPPKWRTAFLWVETKRINREYKWKADRWWHVFLKLPLLSDFQSLDGQVHPKLEEQAILLVYPFGMMKEICKSFSHFSEFETDKADSHSEFRADMTRSFQISFFWGFGLFCYLVNPSIHASIQLHWTPHAPMYKHYVCTSTLTHPPTLIFISTLLGVHWVGLGYTSTGT